MPTVRSSIVGAKVKERQTKAGLWLVSSNQAGLLIKSHRLESAYCLLLP